MPFYQLTEDDVSTEGPFTLRDFSKIRRPALVLFMPQAPHSPNHSLMHTLERLNQRIQQQMCHILLVQPDQNCRTLRRCAASTLGLEHHTQSCPSTQSLLFLTDLRGRLVRQLDVNIPYQELERQFIEAQLHF